MKTFKNENVLDAARKRMRWIFSEFDNVVVSTSGGKDSTVTFQLALEAAREADRLPLKVLFLDQEAEWQATIDSVRQMMEHPDVEPYWLQIPFKLFNATSVDEHWLECWDERKEDLWIRPKESYAITENNFGTDRFSQLFKKIPNVLWPDKKTAFLAGVRCEESPSRTVALTHSLCYKWVTWGKTLDPITNVTFYPIYDWATTDIWKAIDDHDWPYCKLYDHFYRYGVATTKMRVSNVHHETAVWALFVLQEIEPQTYERLVHRIEGIDMAGKMGVQDYFPKVVPPMFGDWKDYRDHLLEKLITDLKLNSRFKGMFSRMERDMAGFLDNRGVYKAQVMSILCNDHEGVKVSNFLAAPENYAVVKSNRKLRMELAEAEKKETIEP